MPERDKCTSNSLVQTRNFAFFLLGHTLDIVVFSKNGTANGSNNATDFTPYSYMFIFFSLMLYSSDESETRNKKQEMRNKKQETEQ